MKALVVYDSVYGNTEQVARAIGGALGGEARVVSASAVVSADLLSLDLLIVGAPTQGGRGTLAALQFLGGLSRETVRGLKVAAFDTRISARWVGIFGYAAGKIAKNLMAKGGHLAVPPEGFIVKGKEGPLKEGELERAAWAKMVGGIQQ